ncbi:MAG: pyridoxal phosphate-dependent aminotransferase [Myxococcales bacterium]|nr:pyridoxal phosphate-dependent aminotransferase [Myxococcales bacterium]MCB9625735.1 pyridoxal phosphate-dependent aminotransferase [Sandaracinaceae bacterium]
MNGTTDPRLSLRTEQIAPFLAMEVMERGMALAREGHDVIQLGVGEPDFDAPPEAVRAAMDALARGETHYTDSRGLRSLREAIAADSQARRGVATDPDRVLVTLGTSPAILMALQVLVNPGDEVLIPTPHYPCYPNMVVACGGVPRFVPTFAADGYRIDVAALEAARTPRTKAIMLASPANPTGAVQPRETVEAIAALGLPVLSDEIYDGLLFDGQTVTSPLGFSEDTFVLDGFSKRYAMTGFRLGYLIAPAWASRALQSLQQSQFISATHFVQSAGIAALTHGAPHLEHMRGTYQRRRDLLLAGLRELGLGIPTAPTGAFYILADARHLGQDSLAMATRIVEQAHVAVGPGRDFGVIAEGHLRFSYATSEAQIERALERLARALPALRS